MGMTELIVSVNVSTKQFSIGDFPAMVAEVLEETHLPPQNLELEITEGTLAQDIDYAVKMVNELKRLGVRISLDDFGTGYSSFSYVKDFPLNTLKIDRSFLIGVPHDNNSVAIVGAIISLCKGLGLHIVAEGVEDTEQLALMSESGCHEIQGFLFSRPLNFDDFLSWVKARDWLKHFKNDSEKGESDEDSSVQHKKVS